ncbi:MAG: hypothetical protein ACRDH2_03635 [Anaerolineales bacterium]
MLSSDSSLTRPGLREGRQSSTAKAETLLQASRRVDWRFLLPDPNLGQVAYLGPARGSLCDSLRLFSAGLTVIESPQAPNAVQYDVVVASNPSPDAFRLAAPLVRPAGFLYAEIHQRWPGHRRNPAEDTAVLKGLGFAQAEAYWHWPNFEGCMEIVPLSDPAALRHALNRRRSDLAARAKALLGHGLLRSGGLALLIPCFSVVGQRSAA